MNTILFQLAERHQLPANLVQAIIHVESNGNPFAVRYEPAFAARYLDKSLMIIKSFAPCSETTERMARACSWGLMQVMGQVAREHGFKGPYLSALCDPEIGIEYGCLHLAKKVRSYYAQYGWPGVISAYNAGIPKEPDYPYTQKVLALWTP